MNKQLKIFVRVVQQRIFFYELVCWSPEYNLAAIKKIKTIFVNEISQTCINYAPKPQVSKTADKKRNTVIHSDPVNRII